MRHTTHSHKAHITTTPQRSHNTTQHTYTQDIHTNDHGKHERHAIHTVDWICIGRAFGETLSTLKFAQRAKLIKNKAARNEDFVGNVRELQAEVKRLRELLAEC